MRKIEKNTWKLYLIGQYLKKLIKMFQKNYSNKLTAIFPAVQIVLQIIRLIVKFKPIIKFINLIFKQKYNLLAKNGANK